MVFYTVCFLIQAVVVLPVLSKLLIVKDNQAPQADKFLRGYAYYAKQGARSDVRLECSLPSWYNETADVRWEGGSRSTPRNQLVIGQSTASPAEFVCSARTAADKPIAEWEDTKLRFYRSSRDVTITGPSVAVLNYSSTATLEFSCQVNAATVSWFLDGQALSEADKNVKIFTNNTLLIHYPTYKDVGVYMCVTNDGTNRSDFFSLEGAPFFAAHHGKFEDSENKLEGESISVIHELFGNPLSDLEWSIQEDEDTAARVIDKAHLNSDHRIKIYPSHNVTNGILELNDLKKTDRAYYLSKATNVHGSHQFKTLIRVKGKLDALWPFLGIVAEVIILVAIILIYERRRMKQEREADEALDQKKPLTSTNNDSVRQRKN